ncbi:MAG: hypothetical protein LBV58_04990 [Acholeplasmatales bacterium]|nr:hypothetical protein [Acholeplasmatales bacterium]
MSKCEYCGTSLGREVIDKCPYCGAKISNENTSLKRTIANLTDSIQISRRTLDNDPKDQAEKGEIKYKDIIKFIIYWILSCGILPFLHGLRLIKKREYLNGWFRIIYGMLLFINILSYAQSGRLFYF